VLSYIVLQRHKETEHNSLLSLVPRFTESLTPRTSPRIFRSAANRIRIGLGSDSDFLGLFCRATAARRHTSLKDEVGRICVCCSRCDCT
jgi:hypothetical protein